MRRKRFLLGGAGGVALFWPVRVSSRLMRCRQGVDPCSLLLFFCGFCSPSEEAAFASTAGASGSWQVVTAHPCVLLGFRARFR